MTAEERKKFATELVEADMHQDDLEEYLQGDMTKSPKEFLEAKNAKESGESFGEYLEDKFPKEG